MSEFFDGDALKASRYLERFRRLSDELPGHMILKGDMMLVEKLPPLEMKTKGGLIIGTASTHRDTARDTLTEFGVVLAAGPGQIFEDGSLQEPDSKPGDVILLPGTVTWYSQFGHIQGYDPYSIGRIRDAQVPLWFKDYQKVFDILNG